MHTLGSEDYFRLADHSGVTTWWLRSTREHGNFYVGLVSRPGERRMSDAEAVATGGLSRGLPVGGIRVEAGDLQRSSFE